MEAVVPKNLIAPSWSGTLSAMESAQKLVDAVAQGDVQETQRLLRRGADANARNMWGQPVLHLAVAKGSTEIVQLLLQAGADVFVRDPWERYPVTCAIDEGHHELAYQLIDAAAQTHGAPPRQHTATTRGKRRKNKSS